MENQILSFSAQQRISSLEIAKLVEKSHKNVMRDIREMENAWVNVAGLKFELGSYLDKNGQLRPCYILTLEQSLYVATKYNNEARAKLVLRWLQLEQDEHTRLAMQLAAKDADAQYAHDVLESNGTMTTTEIAKQLGMSARMLNQHLHHQHIIFKQSRTWFLYAEYQDMGLVDYKTRLYVRADGRYFTRRYLRWTEKGKRFIFERVASRQQKALPERPRYIEMTFQFTY